VARKYRAYRASEGVYERALLVPDRQGTIAWSYCSPIAVNPGADGILDALERVSDQARAHGQVVHRRHTQRREWHTYLGERHDGAYDYASLVAGIRMRSAADTIP
jgi:hypothetical protein